MSIFICQISFSFCFIMKFNRFDQKNKLCRELESIVYEYYVILTVVFHVMSLYEGSGN